MPKSRKPGRAASSPVIPSRRQAFYTILAYVIIAVLWLVGSDWLVAHLIKDPDVIASFDVFGDCLFVLLTAIVLALFQERYFREVRSLVNQLSEGEKRLRSLGDNLPNTYVYQYIPDANGKPCFTYISGGVERLHGVKPSEVLRDSDCLRQLVLPESRSALAAAEAASASALTDFEIEVWVSNREGRKRLMHLHAHPHENEAGVIQWDGVATDITEAKQAELVLHERERQLRLFVEHSPAAIAMLDADMRYLITSRRWLADYRLAEQDVVGRSHYEIFPEIPERWKEIHRRCLAGAVEKCDADPFPRADGTLDWVRWEIRPWCAEHDTIGGLIIFSEVITERKAQELEIHRLQRLYATLSQVNQTIVLCHSRTELFDEISRVMIQFGRFRAVWIGERAGDDGDLSTITSCVAEPHQEPLNGLGNCGVIDEAMRSGRPALCNQALKDPRVACCHGMLSNLGVQSCAAFPLRLNGEIFGAFFVCSGELEFFRAEERVLVEEIATDISYALDRLAEQEQRRQAEAAMRESEHLFRALVEAAPEAIFVRTGQYFAYVNGAALKLFGASSVDQLLEQRVIDRFRADGHPEVCGRMEKLDQGGASTLEADGVLLKLDGSEVEVSISAVPINFRGKQSALVFAHDVSDRKRAEAALWHQLELQDQLARIAATVPGTIYSFRLRPDGSMAMPYASAALEKIFGVQPEQVREDASTILALIHPDDAPRVRESILSSARTLNPWREEFRSHGTQRGEIWVEGHSVPQPEPDGSVLWHGFLSDITERRQAEEQLRKLSRAVEQSPASIVITDAKGDIEYINPKFTELTGYTLEEVRGRNPRMLKSGNTSAHEYRQLWQTIKRGETWRGEFLNRKKNGQAFCEFASISAVTDDAGNITHFLAVKEDITERKQLEAQFRQSQKMEAIGTLAGGVAHDFNNILAAMMMQVDLASMSGDLSEEVREGLSEIRAATDRAASLTRQLLLFSRQQVLQPRDLDLNEVVTSLAKMLQRIIREDVRLQLNLHPSPLITHADAGMLDQVLMNLAVNARDAMPKGGRLFIETSECIFDGEATRSNPDAAPGRYVSLSVTDTGTGMTPEVVSRIFEPFFTTKEPGKGTGLGLATVFGIIKQHRGWITVHSEPGNGARFQVYLPASEGTAADAPMAARPVSRTGTETILLVEDESSLRRMTRMLLERHGYVVIEAANGVEARQVWKQHRDTIALLLTDLVMPSGMTGQQLARELQSEQPKLKVVFTSGYSAEIAGGEIHLRTGENFLQKPCSPALLLETIRKTLEN